MTKWELSWEYKAGLCSKVNQCNLTYQQSKEETPVRSSQQIQKKPLTKFNIIRDKNSQETGI